MRLVRNEAGSDAVKLAVVAATVALAVLPFILRKKVPGKKTTTKAEEPKDQSSSKLDVVEEASLESFPASDPPAY